MHKHSSHCTQGLTVEQRLLHYLPDRPDGACWLWTGTTNRGYGALGFGGKMFRAHRVAYETWVGPIPEGLTIDHVYARGCRSTLCCNPAHLEPTTLRENQRRRTGLVGPTRPRCKNGHEWTEANTYRRPNGQRSCRACGRAAVARYKRGSRGRVDRL